MGLRQVNLKMLKTLHFKYHVNQLFLLRQDFAKYAFVTQWNIILAYKKIRLEENTVALQEVFHN